MKQWLHAKLGCLFFWRRVKRPFAIHGYFECQECGRRTVARSPHGYQPVDADWLERRA